MEDESRIEDICPDRFDHIRNTLTLALFLNNISPTIRMIIFMYDLEERTIINREQHPELFVMLRQPRDQHVQFNRFILFEMPSQTPILLNILADLNLELRLGSYDSETGRFGDISIELWYY